MNFFKYLTLPVVFLLITACSEKTTSISKEVKLGGKTQCQQYSGLPQNWMKKPEAGMVKITGGTFQIGNNESYPEERALYQSERTVTDFWMDETEVTNAQFESFVKATGYITEAEKQGEAAVFIPPQGQVKELAWWSLVKGASWKKPWGENASRQILPNEPVRMITLKDAIAYADWLGHELPTEEQWEYAAKGFTKARDVSADLEHINANVWQGEFPYQNDSKDGFTDVAPVGCFAANGFGLYDMIGNVWEYTNSPFSGTHDDHMGVQQLKSHQASTFNQYTIKGGSFLCASNYCMRYRASARHSQEADLGISHVGFRTVKKIK
ncbi:formylglycine-generating enzyme family protein [Acinetobacter sichuanensis]|uniref:Formylglycine-generating enzyme family protein n=1 Tax=Acinetobacter sichuanensis TaxID=2136183 RepID=A0A371YP66_9GAMM|nr:MULTISPECIES: formylglycine-generating enzyme family protein [Acinetobacter]MDM1768035.1 formylglycine-generating enzyme family protein [Acinetobacter sp. 226-4]RFC83267.1 formylglycine-generating enzyme family protein [Acinetobacter sichuanensis]